MGYLNRIFPYNNKLYPKEIDGREIEEFLTYPAVEKNVAASTQRSLLRLGTVLRWASPKSGFKDSFIFV